jgi:hypothetical protein
VSSALLHHLLGLDMRLLAFKHGVISVTPFVLLMLLVSILDVLTFDCVFLWCLWFCLHVLAFII